MTNRLSILLVEDNVLNQKVITFSLKRLACDVLVANNGLEGFELFKKHQFDFILMDIMMPIMDGFEATQEIRMYEQEYASAHTPIIALTANTLDNDRDKCIEFGMDEFLSKPFRLEELQEALIQIDISI